MSWRWIVMTAFMSAAALPSEGVAQALPRGFAADKEKTDQKLIVPKPYLPPAGMCRIWLDGVPPAQQPAPTDCATAIKNRPTKGRVIFGDDTVAKDRDKNQKGDDKAKPRKP